MFGSSGLGVSFHAAYVKLGYRGPELSVRDLWVGFEVLDSCGSGI